MGCSASRAVVLNDSEAIKPATETNHHKQAHFGQLACHTPQKQVETPAFSGVRCLDNKASVSKLAAVKKEVQQQPHPIELPCHVPQNCDQPPESTSMECSDSKAAPPADDSSTPAAGEQDAQQQPQTEEDILEVSRRPDESRDSFSLRAFGVEDGNWLCRDRRGEKSLVERRLGVLGAASDVRTLLQMHGQMEHWPALKASGLVCLNQRELLPSLVTHGGTEGLARIGARLQAAGLSLASAAELGGMVASVRRPRILCFHGMSCSAEILESMICPLSLSLLADYVTVEGPHTRASLCPNRPLLEPLSAGWPDSPQLLYTIKQQPDSGRPDEPATYAALADAIQYCCDQCTALGAEHGRPFDGVLGFSQGAHMATLLAAAAAAGRVQGQPPMKFALLFCGSEWGWRAQAEREHAALRGAFPVPTPAVIVQGAQDPLGDPRANAAFAECFESGSRVELSHSSGHIPFPPSEIETVNLCECMHQLVTAAVEHPPPHSDQSQGQGSEVRTQHL